MSSSADAPGQVAPEPEGGLVNLDEGGPESGHEDEQTAQTEQTAQNAQPGGTGGSGDDALSSPSGRRRLARSVAALAVAAAVVTGAIAAAVFTGNSAPTPAATAESGSLAATGTAAAGHALVANEAAATVAVVKTGGSITGGPLLGRDGQLWLVEASKATGRPMLAVVNPTTYAVSTHPLPASLAGLPVRYTGAAAVDALGQVWLGAKEAPAGQQPTSILVRYLPGTGAVTQYSLSGTCGDDAAAQPAKLFTASDGGVWVECAASQDSGATFVARLNKDGVFTQPATVNTLSRALQGTRLWDEIAGLPQAEIGPLVPAAGGVMWGMTTGGFVQFTTAGTEMFTPSGQDATEVATQAIVKARAFQLVGNGESDSIAGLGECHAFYARASQSQECAVSVNSVGGKAMLAAAPDYDGHVGNPTVHPAGMDQSGDVWFIVDGTAGGKAPAGQYFFEVNSGGGTRLIPFSVPGDTRPIPVGQAPVITQNGAVWTADPASGPGTLVEVMPTN